jgi:hypothetical protein
MLPASQQTIALVAIAVIGIGSSLYALWRGRIGAEGLLVTLAGMAIVALGVAVAKSTLLALLGIIVMFGGVALMIKAPHDKSGRASGIHP